MKELICVCVQGLLHCCLWIVKCICVSQTMTGPKQMLHFAHRERTASSSLLFKCHSCVCSLSSQPLPLQIAQSDTSLYHSKLLFKIHYTFNSQAANNTLFLCTYIAIKVMSWKWLSPKDITLKVSSWNFSKTSSAYVFHCFMFTVFKVFSCGSLQFACTM